MQKLSEAIYKSEIQMRTEAELADVPLIAHLPVLNRLASTIDLHITPRLLSVADEITEEMLLTGKSSNEVELVMTRFAIVFDNLKCIVEAIEQQESKPVGSELNKVNNS